MIFLGVIKVRWADSPALVSNIEAKIEKCRRKYRLKMQMFLGGGLSSVAPPQAAYFLGCWMIRGLEHGGNYCPEKIEP